MIATPLSGSNAHLVTGATGFVGSAIILELLQRTDAPVVGIVRSTNAEAATQRLIDVLVPLIDGYDLPSELRHDVENRVTAVVGDIEHPFCGTEPAMNTAGAEFWHCAASLQFQDRHWEQIRRTNVDGMSNAIQLARRIASRRFNMISTAYVAGHRSGVVAAGSAAPGFANNRYEESKVAAEQLIADAGLEARIMRPGVVIGHSRTKYSSSEDGLYGFLRSLIRFRGLLERTQPGLAARRQVRLVGDSKATLDLVPVDHVASEAVGLSTADAPHGFYHLTNSDPPLTVEVVRQSFLSAGLLAPHMVDDQSGFDGLERKLHQRLTFYSSYLINPKSFDRQSVNRALGQTSSNGFAMPSDLIRDFCDWYSDRFQRSRPSLPPAR